MFDTILNFLGIALCCGLALLLIVLVLFFLVCCEKEKRKEMNK